MFQTTRDESLGEARTPDQQSATRPDARPLAFELTGLSKVYHRGKDTMVRAVDTLSLSAPAGQVVGLLGPNGAGKTTTIKMMCGLVAPTSGRVQLRGYDVAKARPMAVRQVGAVLEGARNVYWSLSAWQNLLYFGRLKGLPRKLIVPRAESLLRSLDIWKQRRQETYEIRLGGPLASSTFPWLDGFSVTSEDSESLIRGPTPDQERLYDLLAQLRAQHLPLIAVEPVEPNLEDVFVQILKERE